MNIYKEMDTYILKNDVSEGLLLLTKTGERIPLKKIVEQCAPRRIFALHGKMGAGKTTFIKQLLREMGSDDIVNSPTFAIVNVYDIPTPESVGTQEVYHFDCYRLKTLTEALDLGAEEYLYSGNYCFIEWPDIISRILPEDTVYLRFRVLENGDRELTMDI